MGTHLCDTAAIVATRVALNEDDLQTGLIDKEHTTYKLFRSNLSEYLHCIDILLRRGDAGLETLYELIIVLTSANEELLEHSVDVFNQEIMSVITSAKSKN